MGNKTNQNSTGILGYTGLDFATGANLFIETKITITIEGE